MSRDTGHFALPAPPIVVLVDDDVALRTALTFSLQLDGFDVRAYASGEEALEADMPQTSACLVFDYNLQGMTGLSLLQRLRRRAVALPALLITSHPPRSVRETAAGLSAVIIEKPLLTDALTHAIRSALGAPGAA